MPQQFSLFEIQAQQLAAQQAAQRVTYSIQPIQVQWQQEGAEAESADGDTSAPDTSGLDNPESAIELIRKLRAEIKDLKGVNSKPVVPDDVANELKELREAKAQREKESADQETAALQKKGDYEKLLEKTKLQYDAQIQSLQAKLKAAEGEKEAIAERFQGMEAEAAKAQLSAEIARAYFANGGAKNPTVESMLKQSLLGSLRLNDDGSIHILDGENIRLNEKNEPMTLADYMGSNPDLKTFFPVPPSTGTGRSPGESKPGEPISAAKGLTIPRSALGDLTAMRAWKQQNNYEGSVTDGIGSKITVVD